MDCHSTLIPFCCPHSTKVSPTALSVISFQLAENHTLKTPAGGAAGAAGAPATAAVVGAAAGAGGVVGAAAGLDAAGCSCPHAATIRPTAHALRARNCRRE